MVDTLKRKKVLRHAIVQGTKTGLQVSVLGQLSSFDIDFILLTVVGTLQIKVALFFTSITGKSYFLLSSIPLPVFNCNSSVSYKLLLFKHNNKVITNYKNK